MSALADALSGPTGKFIKWDTVGRGTIITGTVTGTEVRQCRSFDTKELETWNDGTPKQEARIGLQTQLRDPSDPEDNGDRTLVINLWGQQKRALGDACRAAGVPEPAVGDEFSAVWSAGVGGSRDPRQFAYKVVKGTGLGAAIADPLIWSTNAPIPTSLPGTAVGPAPEWAQPTPTSAPPAQAAAPAPAADPFAPAVALAVGPFAPAPAPATPDKPSGVELATQLLRLGVTQPQAAQASGLDLGTVAALANAITAGTI